MFFIKKFILKFMLTSFYKYLLKKVIPYIRFTTYYPSLNGRQYKKLYANLRAGDVILSIDHKKLTTSLISKVTSEKNGFSHASLCVSVGNINPWEIAEMTHNNYTKSTFFDICRQSDRVVIMRLKENDSSYVEAMINKCKQFSGANYDYMFNDTEEALYCSELIDKSDFEGRINADKKDLIGLGISYVSPTGLYNAPGLRVVIDSEDIKKCFY